MPASRLRRSLRVTFLGMGFNLLLAAGKLVAGIAGHSHALVADAVESFADVFSSLIVWRGLVLAAAPADENHPFGHGKAEPIAAAMVAALLMLAALGIAVGAVQAILRPHEGPAPFTLLVLLGVVLLKELLFRWVVNEGRRLDSLAVRSDAWHHRTDAVTSAAAAVGIGVALLGGPGYEAADDFAALAAAGIIAWNGWKLLRPALDELMDATPGHSVTGSIREIAHAVPGVQRVEKCVVRKTGYHYLVDMHVEVDPQMTVQTAHDIAHQVKDAVQARMPNVSDVLVHVEPGGHGESENQ